MERVLQTALLALECLEHWAAGRVLQGLSLFCSDLHVLLQRHLPSMWFEEQVCFPTPDFCRRYAPKELGPAWFILGLAGHRAKDSLYCVYPFKQRAPFQYILKRNNTCSPLWEKSCGYAHSGGGAVSGARGGVSLQHGLKHLYFVKEYFLSPHLFLLFINGQFKPLPFPVWLPE